MTFLPAHRRLVTILVLGFLVYSRQVRDNAIGGEFQAALHAYSDAVYFVCKDGVTDRTWAAYRWLVSIMNRDHPSVGFWWPKRPDELPGNLEIAQMSCSESP
jgi:hypothetical protein